MSSNLIYSASAARVLNSLQLNEHTAGDRTPYCYLIGWTQHNMWYYGRRTAEGCHPSEFWKKYKTSSNHVDEFVEKFGDPDHIEIRTIFTCVDTCARWETNFLTRIDAARRSNFLNKRNGDLSFHSTNMISVKDIFGKTLSVDNNDPRFLSGELVGIAKGMLSVLDENNNKLRITVDQYRNDTTKYKTPLSECCMVKDSIGNTYKVMLDDPRFLSGELVAIATDTVVVTQNGVNFRVSNVDPRFLSGELPAFNVGFSAYYTNDGKITYLHKDDPILKSGEVSHINKNMVMVIDKEGNSFQTTTDDPEYINGNLKFHLTNRAFGLDSDGNIVSTHKGDSRFSTGGLRGTIHGKHIIKNIETNQHYVVDRDDERLCDPQYAPINTGMLPVNDLITGERIQVTVDEYKNNPDKYSSLMDGFAMTKDSFGNVLKVSKTDPRFLSGELVGIAKGKTCARTFDGKRLMVSVDDPRFLSGELVGVTSGKKHYIDANGKRTLLFPTDDRVINNEVSLVDMKKEREILRNRKEVLYLKSVAKERNIKLRPCWEWAIDISTTRDIIINGPANISYAKRK